MQPRAKFSPIFWCAQQPAWGQLACPALADYAFAAPLQIDDECLCASYRFVGSALQVPSCVAQRALHDYCSKSDRLAIYLVAGEVETGPMAPRELYVLAALGNISSFVMTVLAFETMSDVDATLAAPPPSPAH